MENEYEKLREFGIAIEGALTVECGGNACADTKLSVTRSYPNPPRVKVRNSGDKDIQVKVWWSNPLGTARTSRTIWAGETEEMDGPPQYWGVRRYESDYI